LGGNVFSLIRSAETTHSILSPHAWKHSSALAGITEFRDQRSPSSSTGSSYLRRIRLHTFSSPPQFLTFNGSKFTFSTVAIATSGPPSLRSVRPFRLTFRSHRLHSDAAARRFLFLSSSGFLSSEWNALFVRLCVPLVLPLNISVPQSQSFLMRSPEHSAAFYLPIHSTLA